MAQNQSVSVTDAGGKVVTMEIAATGEAVLKKFSPSQMAQNLSQEISKVNSASRAAWSHSTRSLPAESGVFMLSMGAVVAGQVLLDGSQNPLALHEFLNHQLSPLGTTSFFAFMYSQGVTSNVLSLYLEHPALRSMIPYLGMTVGAFIQSNLSQFASDADVQMCARSWLPASSSMKLVVQGPVNPCDQAYEKFVNRRKIWEAAPGITSMLLSSALSSGGQTLLRGGVLRLTGFDLMMWMMPGGLQMKGLRMLLVKGLQIGVFVALDSWLHGKVNYAWKNVVDGSEFNSLEAKLVQEIQLQKTLRWNAQNRDLIAQLKVYHTRSSDWRMFNLSDVYEAHHAWSENLNHLTGMYNASYNFYTAFINELRSAGQNPNAPLNRLAPLNGVTAKGLKAEDADLYFTDPQFVETMQLSTIQDVATSIQQKVSTGAYRDEGVSSLTVSNLKKFADQLGSGNRQSIGEALAFLQKTLFSNSSLSGGEFAVEMYKIHQQLGRPAPALKKGYGFVSSYENAPSTGAALKDIPFYRRLGSFKTETITDYLLASMICGPDVEKGQRAVFNTAGFPGIFTPPKIHQDGISVDSICQVTGASGEGFAPSRLVIPATDSPDAIDFLKNYTRASVLGSQSENQFQTWWEQNTQSQMQKTVEIYAQSYVKIIAKLLGGVFREDRALLNAGDMPNGTAQSLLREARLNTKILSEMLSGLSSTLRPPIQTEFEQKLTELIGLLRRVQIVTDAKGNMILQSNLKNKEIEDKKAEVQAILSRWAQGLGTEVGQETPWVRLDSVQKELVSVCLENLNMIAMEAGNYTSIAAAMTWEKVNGNEVSNDQEKAFEKRKQEQWQKMNNSLLPGKI